jgi:hypothetical protein
LFQHELAALMYLAFRQHDVLFHDPGLSGHDGGAAATWPFKVYAQQPKQLVAGFCGHNLKREAVRI